MKANFLSTKALYGLIGMFFIINAGLANATQSYVQSEDFDFTKIDGNLYHCSYFDIVCDSEPTGRTCSICWVGEGTSATIVYNDCGAEADDCPASTTDRTGAIHY
jgi:hypothetical protein